VPPPVTHTSYTLLSHHTQIHCFLVVSRSLLPQWIPGSLGFVPGTRRVPSARRTPQWMRRAPLCGVLCLSVLLSFKAYLSLLVPGTPSPPPHLRVIRQCARRSNSGRGSGSHRSNSGATQSARGAAGGPSHQIARCKYHRVENQQQRAYSPGHQTGGPIAIPQGFRHLPLLDPGLNGFRSRQTACCGCVAFKDGSPPIPSPRKTRGPEAPPPMGLRPSAGPWAPPPWPPRPTAPPRAMGRSHPRHTPIEPPSQIMYRPRYFKWSENRDP